MKRKAIKCKQMASYLCENLTDGLASARCRALKKHLAHCPNCTAYLDSLRKTVYLYKTYPDPLVPWKTRKKLHSILRLPN